VLGVRIDCALLDGIEWCQLRTQRGSYALKAGRNRKMLEGKITSKKYAYELKKEVRRERNASTGRFLRRDRVGRQASA
jgi:hypothetical protein